MNFRTIARCICVLAFLVSAIGFGESAIGGEGAKGDGFAEAMASTNAAFAPPREASLESFASSVTNTLAKLPADSVLGSLLQDVQFYPKYPVFWFLQFEKARDYIQNGGGEDIGGFKKELLDAKTVIETLYDAVLNFPSGWSKYHVKKALHRNSNMMGLHSDICVALVAVELWELDLPDSQIVDYLLEKAYLAPGKKNFRDVDYSGYLRGTLPRYRSELMARLGSTTNVELKGRIIGLFRGRAEPILDPELESMLIDQFDLESSDHSLNIHIVATLGWIGGNRARGLLDQIINEGPEYLTPHALLAKKRLDKAGEGIDLGKLEKESDLVAVVDVFEIEQTGIGKKFEHHMAFSCNKFTATCKILEGFKGQDATGSQITVEFLQGKYAQLGMESLGKGENAVVFLRNGNGGHFVFADDQCSKMPIGSFVSGIGQQGDSLRQRMGRQLVANLDSNNAMMLESALRWASIIEYPIPEKELDRLSESTNSNIRAVALVPLVRQRKKPAIKRSVNMMLYDDQASRKRIEALAWALEEAADSVPVAQANQLAASGDAMVRKIGMRILRTVGDESSVPVLLGGLDSEDRNAQYSAVVGLCRVTRQKGLSWREFMQNPEGEVIKWKRWGRKRVKAINSEGR